MLRALVALLTFSSLANAFSNLGGKLLVGSRPLLAPHISKTAGDRLHVRQSITPAKLWFGDAATVASVDTTDFVVDLFNYVGEYNMLVGFSMCMAFWLFAKTSEEVKGTDSAVTDSAVSPKQIAPSEPPSRVIIDPKGCVDVDLPGLKSPLGAEAVRPLLEHSDEGIKLEKPKQLLAHSETGITSQKQEELEANPSSRFGFRRRISAAWNHFRNGVVGPKVANPREDRENILLRLDALKGRLQTGSGKESKEKLVLAAEQNDASTLAKDRSASASVATPGPVHASKEALPVRENKWIGRLDRTLGKLWNAATVVGKVLKPQKAYLANMVLLTGLTGGIMSSTMQTSSALVNMNGRLSTHGHTVVLADKLDDKVLTVLCGMANEAATSNDAAGRLSRGVVVLTPQDRIAVHQQIESRLADERGHGVKLDFVTRQGDPTVMEDLNKVCVKDASHVVWVKQGASSDGSASSSRPSHLNGAGAAFASPPLAGASKKTAREAALLRELRGNQDAERNLE
eukprot:CAMPEP_0181288074 /NCGR_PEP_ID=MMETSP1101-20121128/132_1 /TAXON_ID=46948 /ORGANISM="Rhodomonas abbreviata, Strain Caron Lab Isolate" /LENGTH=513 /DNA_ID=CAMNT_0023392159 /DNA_START=27 /DNA_END=1565 /DNA_ORIENTATION=+